jgi:hypothetical protein
VRALRSAISALKTYYGPDWVDIYIATTVAGQKYQGILAGVAGSDFMMPGRVGTRLGRHRTRCRPSRAGEKRR